ncbi:MAG: hypothetical protein GY754_17445 [bacterium]|nr:hypothetical protein [bacterium]
MPDFSKKKMIAALFTVKLTLIGGFLLNVFTVAFYYMEEFGDQELADQEFDSSERYALMALRSGRTGSTGHTIPEDVFMNIKKISNSISEKSNSHWGDILGGISSAADADISGTKKTGSEDGIMIQTGSGNILVIPEYLHQKGFDLISDLLRYSKQISREKNRPGFYSRLICKMNNEVIIIDHCYSKDSKEKVYAKIIRNHSKKADYRQINIRTFKYHVKLDLPSSFYFIPQYELFRETVGLK